MSKKKKIVLVIAILLVIGAGVGFYFYNKKEKDSTTGATPTDGILKDKSGNTFELTKQLHPQYPDLGFNLLINGESNGAIASMYLGEDGYVYASNNQGTKYRYTTKWERV